MSVYYLQYRGYWVELPRGDTVVGRDLNCTLRFNDPSISRQHARFARVGGDVTVEDLRSSNGTLVNDAAISGVRSLADRDTITIGTREIVFRILDESQEESTTRRMTTFAALGELGSEPRVATRTLPSMPLAKSDPSDRRRHRRVPIELPIVYRSEDLEIDATTRDLSQSGVFVRTEVLEPIGTRCQLTITVAGQPPLAVRGIVRRVVERDGAEPAGLGIEFIALAATDRRWLELALSRVRA